MDNDDKTKNNGSELMMEYQSVRSHTTLSTVVCSFFGYFCNKIMRKYRLHTPHLDSTIATMENEHKFGKRSVITVMNHESVFDDVLVCSLFLTDWRKLTDTSYLRLSLVAADICYTKLSHSYFFTLANAVPVIRTVRNDNNQVVIRGEGVNQPSMNWLVGEMSNKSRWVNIFPQGKLMIGEDKATETLKRLRWGVGRLVAEVEPTPLVIPVWLVGMGDAIPDKRPHLYHAVRNMIFRRPAVTVYCGKPLDLSDEVQNFKSSNFSADELRSHITNLIQEEFYKLKHTAESYHANRYDIRND